MGPRESHKKKACRAERPSKVEEAKAGECSELTDEHEIQDRYAAIVASSLYGFWLTDAQGRIIEVNQAFCEMLGYSRQELLGMTLADIKVARSSQLIEQKIQEAMHDGRGRLETRLLCKDGTALDVEASFGSVDVGEGRQFFAFVRDIKGLKSRREFIRQTSEKWERTFNAISDPIAIIDENYKIIDINMAMAESLGKLPEECIGQTCYRLVHLADAPPDNCPHARTLSDGQSHKMEIEEEAMNGFFMVATSPLTGTEGRTIGSVHVAHDITDRKQAEDALSGANRKLEDLAYRDVVTDLANRRHFAEEIDRALEEHNRYGVCVSLMLLDIDGFKALNDAHGHQYGDEALKTLAQVLVSSVRKADFVGRWGGDEFSVLMSHTPISSAMVAAERIRRQVEAECVIRKNGGEIRMTISAGLACAEEGSDISRDQLLRSADTALYAAKHAGGDRICIEKA